MKFLKDKESILGKQNIFLLYEIEDTVVVNLG